MTLGQQLHALNMPDYSAACQEFSWERSAAAFNLPRAHGYNKAAICLDDHPAEVQKRTALIWQGAGPDGKLTGGPVEHYTFAQMAAITNQIAHFLAAQGVEKGDRVFVFLERIPELYFCVFGGLKLQAIVGPLFSAFGPDAIKDRVQDCEAKLIITSPRLKSRIDAILADCPTVQKVVVVDRTEQFQPTSDKEVSFYPAVKACPEHFTVGYTAPDTPSVMHYTSGTTGKPKGALHRHQAILAQALTTLNVLDLKAESDIYWCTADPGWVTGTAYGMFGPWALGVTSLVYEGPFKAEDWYQLIQDHKVTVWYSAPTAIRLLMKAGNSVPGQYNLSTLRHLGSVGEPLNPEAIHWGREVFNGLSFHDTWWQTETGAMQITNVRCLEIKPGSMGKPLPGTEAAILSEEGHPIPVGEEGHLALKPTPSFLLTYWQREEAYNSRFKQGWYLTGDKARQDEEGYYWFIGRADDVINTAGHLVGPFEVESALIEHPAVAEAAVIGKPDAERMEIIKAFVALKVGYEASDELRQDIQTFVRTRLAAHAYPRELDFLPGLPKTRSGKIMRRLLKARELGLPEGDTSTLED